jgi:hypothetical protein
MYVYICKYKYVYIYICGSDGAELSSRIITDTGEDNDDVYLDKLQNNKT